MSILSKLFGTGSDPRENLRPLWHRTIEIAREPEWYASCGVADTIEGRFDMITLVLSAVILRMEKSADIAPQTGLLTELFVQDMDGQLRESGVGDLMVGKKIGRLMSVLGGRIGAVRSGLAGGADALADALSRNVTLTEAGSAECVGQRLEALTGILSKTSDTDLLAAEFPS